MENQKKKRKATLHAFFKEKVPKPTNKEHNSASVDIPNSANVDVPNCNKEQACISPTVEIDISSLEPDSGLRTPIWKYPVNQRDEIIRAYIKRGPYQLIQKGTRQLLLDDSYKSATGSVSKQKDFITVEHHYRVDVFNAVIDFQVEEISGRFNDKAVELLKLSSALEPRDNFKSFNPDDICVLAKKYYFGDFSEQDMHYLKVQLEHYKHNVVEQEKFHGLSTISELCLKLAETNKSVHYNLIDRLIRLVLTLPVSTATTERAFSAMKIVKSVLRNKMNEDFLADSLVINIERQLAKDIDVDTAINEFDSRKNRRVKLQ